MVEPGLESQCEHGGAEAAESPAPGPALAIELRKKKKDELDSDLVGKVLTQHA